MCRWLFTIPILPRSADGAWGDASTAGYVFAAAAAALVATAMMHLLLLSTPRPRVFFTWIIGLATVIAVVFPFSTTAPLSQKAATAPGQPGARHRHRLADQRGLHARHPAPGGPPQLPPAPRSPVTDAGRRIPLTALARLVFPARWLVREMNRQAGLLVSRRGRDARWGGNAVKEDRAHERARGHRKTGGFGGWRGIAGGIKRSVLISLGGALVATVATAAIPLVQRNIIDNVIVTHRQSIWPLAGLLLIAAAVNFAGIYLRRYHGGRLSLDVQHELRTELFDSLSRLDGARQDEIYTGQLVGRSISDLNMVQSILSMVPITLGNLALFILSIGIMVVLSPVLTIVTVTVAPALWIIALASRRRLFPASWHAQQQSGDVAGIVDEAIGGVRVVKGFGQEEQEQERLEDASSSLFASRLRMIRLTARYNPALTAIPSLGMVGVLALGGWLAIHGSLTLGTFLAFSAYLAQMSGPVRTLTMMVTIGQEARASVIRVFDIIDSRPAIADKPGAATLPADATGISFDDVHFGYLPAEPVLRGLSLRVEPGETVAVVGASGSGKSTIALLLPRFYDPQSGSVRIGGHDIKDVTQDSLRAAIGLVMEDSFLFSATVGANIAYGRPDATEEQIVAAAKAAQAHEFIVRLPKGYDTMVGEQGLTLSGGQRQRVALARALVTDPRLLLLDDATSAIDPRLEAEIHAALREVMRGRTTLIIAHRRSTLNLADRIVVLDQGRVADTGTHEELSERCPLYRKLITGPRTPDGSSGRRTGAAGRPRPRAGWPGAAGARRRRAGGRGRRRTRPAADGGGAGAGNITGRSPACRRHPSCSPRSTRCRRPRTCRRWRSARRGPRTGSSRCAGCCGRSRPR